MLEFLRRRVLPWAVWLGAASGAAWLWYGQHVGSARGYVEGISYGIVSPQTGRIASVQVLPGQRVRAGQVIAMLDDREVAEELALLAAERRRVEAELRAAAAETRIRVGDSSREIEESVGSAELARRQARADRSVRAAELAELDAQVEAVRTLVDKRMADRRELVDLEIKHAALRKQLEVDDGLIRQLDTQASQARARRVDLPSDAGERATELLRAALEEIEAKEAVLARRKQALVLRAPGAGEVTALHLREGEVAVEGTVVATIAGPAAASSDGRPVVFVCASEQAAAAVSVGEAVRLLPPEGGPAVLTAHVKRLAPEVGQLPSRCWRDPRIPEYGRGIYVATDDPVALLPGQSFSIELLGEPSPHARPAESLPTQSDPALDLSPRAEPRSSAPTEAAMPTPMIVPPELRARTRFEPSALAWWPGGERYVVASDDTGLADVTEHAPWLFLMDAEGRVDPEPLVIEGLEAMTDVEGLALAPDGALWVLASQSRSRKGKRSKARQLFARVELQAAGARATGWVALAKQLDAAGSEALAALGLPDTEELDVEGLAITAAGGLLLGLKGPLGPRDEAIVWHLPQPETLLATGEIAAAGLVVWGRIPLTVTADGATAPAGIADLLELPDGSLLVAATAAGRTDPGTQDGALYHVRPGATGEPQRVRTFPGRKPEGLSRSAHGDAIAIAFDTGGATPEWTELPWPAR